MLSSRTYVLGLLFFALSWLSYDHYRPWVNFHAEALACLGMVLLFASRLLDHRQPMLWPSINGWVVVAACMPWIWWAADVGLFAGDALVVSLHLTALAAAIATGFNWARDSAPGGRDSLLTALAVVCVLVCIASAAIGLVQWLMLTNPLGMYVVQAEPGDRAMGNLGQPNQLATFLLMGMAALLLLFETKKIGSAGAVVAAGFITLVLVMTQSRSAMLGASLALVFLLGKTPQLVRLRRGPLLAWGLLLVLAVALLPLLAQALMLDGGRNAESVRTVSDRLTIWSQALAGIAEAPWLGYGWNQTPTAHAAGALAVPGSMTFSFAHNVVLDLFAWTGVPLGLLWTGIVLYWLCSRVAYARTPAAICSLAALLPLAAHSMLEFPFAYAYFLVLAGLMIGIVEGDHPNTPMLPVRRRWLWCALLPWTLVGSYVCYEYLQIEEDFRIVRFENLRIGQTPATYQAPGITVLSHMGEMLHAARVRPEPGMAPAEIERLRKVALRFPWGALHLRYAYALALNGDPAGAAQQMRVVHGMFGDFYYQAAKQELRELQQRHPEVAAALELL